MMIYHLICDRSQYKQWSCAKTEDSTASWKQAYQRLHRICFYSDFHPDVVFDAHRHFRSHVPVIWM